MFELTFATAMEPWWSSWGDRFPLQARCAVILVAEKFGLKEGGESSRLSSKAK